uniref:Uncharacterized protein n=1 Tax=Pavo cristatus TaxID=9049 RepID=A0A8C9FGL4_PAVCR
MLALLTKRAENSPLYEYLQDLGHTDFEVCSPVSQKAKQCAVEEGQRERTVHTQSILSKLVECFRSWFPFPQYKKNDDILHRLVRDYFFFLFYNFLS